MVDIVEKLQSKFPHGRCTYWNLYFATPPYPRQEDDLMQQAKNLLRELQKLSGSHPIMFVCWGMAGGIVLKQVIPRARNQKNSLANGFPLDDTAIG
jgi:hypothetical protein